MPVRFAKGHALGNDYIVIDAAALASPLGEAQVRRLCDRHRGVGSDGVLVAELADGIALRILNPDGSEAEKSGNGLRIFAAWLHAAGRVRTGEWFAVRLLRDTVRMRVERELAAGALLVRVEMGRASFRGEDVAFAEEAGEVIDRVLELQGGGSARITTVSLGNPHCVVFVEALEREDFLARAPRLCTHSAFARGTNVQFARVSGERALEAWIWERGAGETLASGSSASAAAAAAVRRGLLPAGALQVQMAGGPADVEVGGDYGVVLVAPATLVYTGALAPGALDATAETDAP